ncbi:uncharacterized protein LOC121984649 isoform X1 [Zingiber officinale]|uniref:RING-type domain-containing protein n=1 Tax=Zingiber officinale TaxID=94328 RepID=A0A8J5GDA1_ZINOF|nr:uncharacterized protein LOC121984649 isoform X1 [Zingiber officinale]KAG6503671.1 hypothetical protein ZIOFF_035995 [Zingiber officinale]
MVDFRHKESDREFRHRLEELLPRPRRGDACADEEADEAGPGGGEGESVDQIARRRRRSDLEGDDLAETSAAARRHDRILSRWAARQAEEIIINNIERRNRESELMALARLHAVSMLDASFLRETRRAQSSVERPVSARAPPSVLQRWRELEGESVARERRRPAPSPTDVNINECDGPESHGPLVLRNLSVVASVSNDIEDQGLSREHSLDIRDGGVRERERVRQIVSGWMTDIAMEDTASQIFPGSGSSSSPRSEWVGERERERVRLVREWMQTVSQQRDVRASRREEQERGESVSSREGRQQEPTRRNLLNIRGRQARIDLVMRNVRERERELQELSERRPVSHFSHHSRIQSVLRGRFLRIGGSIENRQRHSVVAGEISHLRQHHPVSGFSSREGFHPQNDLTTTPQARSQYVDDSRNESSPSTESGLLDEIPDQFQSQSIHQTTEVNLEVRTESRTHSSDMSWIDSGVQEDERLEADTENEQTDRQQTLDVGHSVQQDGPAEEPDRDWQEHADQEWPRETHEDDGQDDHIPEAHENWHDDNSQLTETNWQDRPLHSFSSQHSFPDVTNRFISGDDDSVYNVELQELLSRRSVSNLLHSRFRESLDQLVQSYIDRQGQGQGHEPFQLDMQGMPNRELPEDDQRRQTDDVVQGQQASARPPHGAQPPRPPPPPPLPLWHRSWNRQSIRRSEIEWDIINDLRTDMAKLQQVMSQMHSMLEACMDMQLELQRTVRQEVSAALNHSVGSHGDSQHLLIDGTNWNHVKKGICCVCCDNQIDSLLYRCGHMCTCSRCAHELARDGGKCPLCRAPIVEVIRAYSIV